jgi:pyruvate formate lyase activating enzyme
MRCDFCQNYDISQHSSADFSIKTEPDSIVKDALLALNNIGIAFTYNEPVIWFEFIRDVALKARKKGLRTVMVSNGFVNRDPLAEIISFTDAFNIDLKAFNNNFYKSLLGAELEPVKKALKQIAVSDKHLEVTTLIIPGQNDGEKEMEYESEWIAGELGIDTPLHLSRYFPMFKREDPATPKDTIERLSEIASKHLNYVYSGNIISDNGQNTICPKCGIYRNFTSFSSSIQN